MFLWWMFLPNSDIFGDTELKFSIRGQYEVFSGFGPEHPKVMGYNLEKNYIIGLLNFQMNNVVS